MFDFVGELIIEVVLGFCWKKNRFNRLVQRQTNAHIDTNSHIKLQKDMLQVEQNSKRQLKDFLLKAYVLFMCMSGDSGSGKLLFISFIPLHLKMS